MTIGFYPGSFNPWHQGHFDVLEKSLKVFDKVIVAYGKNPDKKETERYTEWDYTRDQICGSPLENRVVFFEFDGLLVNAISTYNNENYPETITAVIRGLRNGNDLQYEMNQQYWNEDLGLEIPVVYFITDRKLAHISSSAIRTIEQFKKKV
jgi:pantetheine-phosphate adenylyltransferase